MVAPHAPGGHAFAEGSWLHRSGSEGFWRRETRRALVWAVAIPLLILIAALVIGPLALLGLFIYPLQLWRVSRQLGGGREGMTRAFFLILSKFPEAAGIVEFHLRRLAGRKSGLIEYK